MSLIDRVLGRRVQRRLDRALSPDFFVTSRELTDAANDLTDASAGVASLQHQLDEAAAMSHKISGSSSAVDLGTFTSIAGKVASLAEAFVLREDTVADLTEEVGRLSSRINILANARKSLLAGAEGAKQAAEAATNAANEAQERVNRVGAKVATAKPATPSTDVIAMPVCKVADCGNNPKARGLCSKHYARWRRGTLEGFPRE